MLSKKIEQELNKQVNAELYSAYLYLSMSAYLASENLTGFANWNRIQFQEEQMHALKLYDYIHSRGGSVKLAEIKAPKTKWKNVVEVFEEVYKHEQYVTSLINNLVSVATAEKDYATTAMLQWFVNEQVEEEETAQDLLQQLKMIDGKGSALFMLDRELKQRVYTPPANTEV